MDLNKFPMFDEFAADDYYYTLCNAAGALLQGKTVKIYGTTYSGERARVKGMELVDIIRVLERTIGANRF